jgi:serine/threonine protein kinase
MNKTVSKKKGLNLFKLRNYFIDIVKALSYCHKVIKVIHRDIKPDNIMINHNEVAVLIDFGVSALVDNQEDDTLETNIGTQYYQAPEMFKSKQKVRGEATDIWALGITFYELATGSTPYSHIKNPFKLKEEVLDKPIDFSVIKHPHLKACLQMLLDKDPSKRPSI